MITEIKKIIKNKDYLTIYFDYLGVERFTYLNKVSLKYWKSKGISSIKVGAGINVFKVLKTNNYQIVGFIG